MSGGKSGTSEQEATDHHAAPTEELAEALDRLKSRIHEVTEWAERASIPVAAPEDESVPNEGGEVDEPPLEPIHGETRRSSTLGVITSLRKAGAIAGGVFTSEGEVTELDSVDSPQPVSVAGMVALLDLVPPESVLEIRTTVAEWRAARIGDEAFALELRSGYVGRVDDWLASLLPREKS